LLSHGMLFISHIRAMTRTLFAFDPLVPSYFVS
jgi:hypothetical protein